MLEIVHDLAPGASLYFASAFGSQARFAANIEALCDAGADVIVDDVGYLREGVFQDDDVARAINAVVERGCYLLLGGRKRRASSRTASPGPGRETSPTGGASVPVATRSAPRTPFDDEITRKRDHVGTRLSYGSF